MTDDLTRLFELVSAERALGYYLAASVQQVLITHGPLTPRGVFETAKRDAYTNLTAAELAGPVRDLGLERAAAYLYGTFNGDTPEEATSILRDLLALWDTGDRASHERDRLIPLTTSKDALADGR